MSNKEMTIEQKAIHFISMNDWNVMPADSPETNENRTKEIFRYRESYMSGYTAAKEEAERDAVNSFHDFISDNNLIYGSGLWFNEHRDYIDGVKEITPNEIFTRWQESKSKEI